VSLTRFSATRDKLYYQPFWGLLNPSIIEQAGSMRVSEDSSAGKSASYRGEPAWMAPQPGCKKDGPEEEQGYFCHSGFWI
jgi:hypothetical protein